MDWAYRMIAQHSLDPLGLAVVLHLGWRDAPSFRTDRGIARALGQHRNSIVRVTAKLVALGVIERRSGQWVSCETVAIVEGRASAPKPDAASCDTVPDTSGVRTHQVSGGGHIRCPETDTSGVHKRKEKSEKAAPPVSYDDFKRRASRLAPVLSPFQRSRVLAGQPVLIDGETVQSGSPKMEALRAVLRSQDAENKVARHG